MMTETKQWHQAPVALCYCITNNDDVCMSAEYANALEACAEALRRTVNSHGCIDCQMSGSCDYHGIDNLYEAVNAAKAALARLDTLLQDNVDDK
jgi:hypothetical protein